MKQVLNYEKAWKEASSLAKKAPISLNLIKKMHTVMRGRSNRPSPHLGKFRSLQNWIGPEGGKIEEAYFFPPKPTHVAAFMENLMHYLRETKQDKLIQLALFFAQLLIIHPFMDGNGRVARLLIPLFLYKKKILSQPLFFMSGYFMTHRVRYFQKLYDISAEKDWEGWIRFFLIGIIEQGEQNCTQAEALSSLHVQMRSSLTKLLKAQDAKKIVDYLFLHPIFNEEELLEKKLISNAAMRKALRHLAMQGFLKREKSKKEKRWLAPPLLHISKLHK